MSTSIYRSDGGKKVILKQYEVYLNTFDVQVEREYVNTRFGQTHVLKLGKKDGKPLFIFQGGNCVNPMTLSWFTSLADEYCIYAPDTIGHPGYSEERRISAQDDSFAQWICDLLAHFQIEKCAFVGPSYGGGIILRLATFAPEKIACAVLVAPAGVQLGSKVKMIQKVLLPLLFHKVGRSDKHLRNLTDAMSNGQMKQLDRNIIGLIFTHVVLEQDMPKLTTREELTHYEAPTLIVTGMDDIFFPHHKLAPRATELFGHSLEYKHYKMGHFPSNSDINQLNADILTFLHTHY
ncbi:alpha/beta fold hydrolase [Metabacillus iocasae]|uniref:Pimeloyl-ACP methyl ester carboxylesterase n=1 Tax=Priestia iocasae TaxID=2291674 RepID=A0ABS2QW37_9BACI|nr:alpha/beta hydrolase [Metabacillus iocasae]MBM7703493.1 pimeloyl-ACP methyl ester carboxylesterase [Metabacillus iocasae]